MVWAPYKSPYKAHDIDNTSHPLRADSLDGGEAAKCNRPAMHAPMQRYWGGLSNAIFIVCAPLGFEKLGSEIRPRGRVA